MTTLSPLQKARNWLYARYVKQQKRHDIVRRDSCDGSPEREATKAEMIFAPVPVKAFHDYLSTIEADLPAVVLACKQHGWIHDVEGGVNIEHMDRFYAIQTTIAEPWNPETADIDPTRDPMIVGVLLTGDIAGFGGEFAQGMDATQQHIAEDLNVHIGWLLEKNKSLRWGNPQGSEVVRDAMICWREFNKLSRFAGGLIESGQFGSVRLSDYNYCRALNIRRLNGANCALSVAILKVRGRKFGINVDELAETSGENVIAQIEVASRSEMNTPVGDGKQKVKGNSGRKPDTDYKMDKRIHDGWKASGFRSFKDYARKHELAEKEVRKAVDRHKKRLKNSKE